MRTRLPLEDTINSSLIRSLLDELLERHVDTAGVGADAYCTEPLVHPMAEGKFLLAMSAYRRTGLLAAPRFDEAVRRSVERLRDVLASAERGTAFGLGFEWKGQEADVPYLITTAIVADGLAAAAEAGSTHGRALLDGVMAWLRDGVEFVAATAGSSTGPGSEARVPAFDPVSRAPITNAVAYWAAIVRASGLAHPRLAEAETFVLGQYREALGWPYDHDSARFDLLHLGYIARGVPYDAAWTRRVAASVSQFEDRGGFCDKFEFADDADSIERLGRASMTRVRWTTDGALLLFDNPARAWSIGELMVVAAQRSTAPALSAYWRGVADRAAQQAADVVATVRAVGFPRDAMHLAHGFAAVLEARRSPTAPDGT